SFVESFSVAQSLANKDKDTLNANRELAGLGLANITSFLAGTIPVSGAISRTAVNYESGAKTKLSMGLTALFMLLAIWYMTPLFYYLPKAVLAAIIIFAVINLINLKELTYYLKYDRHQAVIFLVTFFAALMAGVVQGLLIGIILSVLIKGLKT